MLFLSKKFLLCNLLCLTLAGCLSTPKKVSLQSENLSFQIKWKYSAPDFKSHSFSSLVSIQGKEALRMDILQPLIGSIASLILNKNNMTIALPLKKEYYKGPFHSQAFFPDFSSFPGDWLIRILRAESPKEWTCQKQTQLVTSCRTHHFQLKWIYKNSRIHKILLRDQNRQAIQAHIKSLSSPEFPKNWFEPKLTKWKKQTDPLFFQNF